MRKRRFKFPVLSRLTQAWIAFGALAVTAGAYVVSATDPGASRVSLNIEIPERVARLAPPRTASLSVPPPPERLGQPPEETAPRIEPFSQEAEDRVPLTAAVGPRTIDLSAPADATPDAFDAYGDEVVITIDGQPAEPPTDGADRDDARRRRLAAQIELASADNALTRETAFGKAPAVSRDGRRPADYYARPFSGSDAPVVALIVGGLGLNRALTERAIDELPPDVTLSFAPYARDLDYWTQKARDAGHEVLIELPMESGRGDDAALGPAALLTSRTSTENLQRLEWILSRYQGYVGATNYLGAKFSSDRASLRPVLDTLAASGLAYFDDTGGAERFAPGDGSSVASVNRVIASGSAGGAARIVAELRALEGVAESKGDAIGKAPLYAATLGDIAAWARSLEGGEDMTLAPASAVLKRRTRAL